MLLWHLTPDAPRTPRYPSGGEGSRMTRDLEILLDRLFRISQVRYTGAGVLEEPNDA